MSTDSVIASLSVTAMVKLLLAGSCNGKYDVLVKRVDIINSKNGPFDVLLCTGSFFASGDDDDEIDTELEAYITGSKALPLPLYFIGGQGKGSAKAIELISKTEGCPLQYLGRRGVRDVAGLVVAFLDGVWNPPAPAPQSSLGLHYTQADIQTLRHQMEALVGDVDLLLTCEWPAGILQGLTGPQLPPDHLAPSMSDCPPLQELASLVRPRYWVAAGQDVFYTRPPYINKDLGAGSRVTRFIGLASVANTLRQKYLHGLALTPANVMEPHTLATQPEGATPSPFDQGSRKRDEPQRVATDHEGSCDPWRWQDPKRWRQDKSGYISGTNSLVPMDPVKCVHVKNLAYGSSLADLESFFSSVGKVVDIRRHCDDSGRPQGYAFIQFDTAEAVERACAMSGASLLGREVVVSRRTGGGSHAPLGSAVATCWFCLASPQADVNLLASVGNHCYLAMDKGAINDTHLLVVPIDHYPSSLTLAADCFEEMSRYISALRSCYAANGMELVAFERFLHLRGQGGNHCHLNMIGYEPKVGTMARPVFMDKAKGYGFSFTELAPCHDLEAARGQLVKLVGDEEFFLVILPDGSRLIKVLGRGDRWAMRLGREVLATLAGDGSRADWRVCQGTPDEELQRIDKFKDMFRMYDPMRFEPAMRSCRPT